MALHIGMFYLVIHSMILHLVIIFLYKLYIIYYFKQGDQVKKSHSNDEVEDSVPHVNRSSASDAKILEYKKLTNLLLGHIDINKDASTCCELNCNNVEH